MSTETQNRAAEIAALNDEAIDLIELTQTAYEQYMSEELVNDQKRTILTKLFDSVTHINNSVSVKYSVLAESIAQRSEESRVILGGKKMLNQTNKNLNDRGRSVEKYENSELFPVWQPLVEELRTLSSQI